MDIHENVLRHIPVGGDDGGPGAVQDGPVYAGPVQVLGPGFAPFKPYLRPRFFFIRVSSHMHVHVHCTVCMFARACFSLCVYNIYVCVGWSVSGLYSNGSYHNQYHCTNSTRYIHCTCTCT